MLSNDEKTTKALHQKHHRIKQWIEQLTVIYNELAADEDDGDIYETAKEHIFYIYRKDMAGPASGIKTSTGFRVLSGSYISPDIVSNMYEVVKKLRQEYAAYIDGQNRLLINLDFDNAGQAARFVTGKQVNGLEEWKTDKGLSLKNSNDLLEAVISPN